MSVSAEETAMRVAVAEWGRSRWPGCRVMHELQIGGCRVDIAFVTSDNLIGVELKSSRDTLKRLDRQVREYVRHLPEVWVAFAPKWMPHFRDSRQTVPYAVGNLMVDQDRVIEDIPWREWATHAHAAERDLTHTAPMLFLLFKEELLAMAKQHAIAHRSRDTVRALIERLARALTGDQIVRGVCGQIQLRTNEWMADPPAERIAA